MEKPKLKPTVFEAFGTTVSDEEFMEENKRRQIEIKREAAKAKRKRAKLCKTVKYFAVVNPRGRTIHITQSTFDTCATDQRKAVETLRDDYGFNIQFPIFSID
jgi:hypothetical protein